MRRHCLLAGFALIVLVAGCHRNEYGFIAARKTGDLSAGAPPRTRFDARGIAACGPGKVSADGRAALRRYPYLQQVTATGAQILWTATGETPAAVRVWPAPGQPAPARESESAPESESALEPETETAPAPAPAPAPEPEPEPEGGAPIRVDVSVDESAPLDEATQYVARVEGLSPDTFYCYELATAKGVWVGPTSLRTAPSPGASSVVRFAAMGDIGKREPDQFAVRDQLETVDMDLLLIAGDVAYDDGKLEEFERNVFGVYRDILRRVPVFPASGNHDYRTDDALAFRQVFSLPENGGDAGRERWYSFDWGHVHVVVLDTEKIGDEQVRWAESDLAGSKATWKVVLAHRPPFSAGTHGDEDDVMKAFVPLFRRHGVDLVLSGHDHHYERSRAIDGIVYVVTGGGGRGTREVGRADTTAFAERVAHFVYVVAGAETLTMSAIDGRGKVFDGVRLEAR